MTRKLVPGILAMAIIVVASNILVQHLFGQWLTWGAFTYPFAFLVTDLTNRFYGAPAARRVVWAGFATGVVCSLVGTQITGEFGPLVTLRVALASGTAFLAAQMLDVTVFDRMRTGAWWKAPLVSTLLGSSLDTALFFTIAFSATLSFIEPANDVSWAGQQLPLLGVGPAAPLWVSLAAADWLVKLALALAALVPFRLILARTNAKVAQKLLTNTKSVPPSLHRQHFERR
ncbi:MAG: queuosine precursor transporter [Cereibacter sp.]